MAVYGIDFYGVGRFGRDPGVLRPDFSVEPFVSTPLDYFTLHLTWKRPSSTDCIYLRLVRNRYNLPQDENDGMMLWGDVTTTPTYMDDVARVPSFTDTGLASGFYYYTMFGWDQTQNVWTRCSDLIALVPINWGYGDRLYNLLPLAYRDRDYVMVDPYNPWPVDSPQPPLYRYLGLLGFQLDFIRSELESLLTINDVQNCSGAVLPLLAQQFGLVHEPEIGMQQERQLISNAVHLYKLKGAPQGITEVTSIMTSYPRTSLAHHGYNELLTMDDGVFYDGTGTWRAWPPSGTNFPSIIGNVGLSLSQSGNMLSGNNAVPGMTDPVGTVVDVISNQLVYPNGLPNTMQPPFTNSGMGIQATGTNLITAENSSFEGGTVGNWTPGPNTNALANSTVAAYDGTHSLAITSNKQNANSSAVRTGVTVLPNIAYLFSAYFQSLGANRQVWAILQFYNSGGTLISTITGNQATEVTNGWVAATVTGTSPATAATVTITLYINNTANLETHLVDYVWLGRGIQDIYITTGGVPITDFISSSYQAGTATFRFQIWSPIARTVEVSIWGDNGSGVPIQVIPPTGALPTFVSQANKWVKYDLTGPVNPYPGVAPPATPGQPAPMQPYGPASYYRLYPRVRIESVGAETHFTTLDALWPCTPAKVVNAAPGGYDYPRDVKVTLQPQFTNLLSNPLTTFGKPNPNYNPLQPVSPTNQPLTLIGFDGLSTAVDPKNPGGTKTSATLNLRYVTTEDAPNTIVPTDQGARGNAALIVNAGGPDAVVWFGRVSVWSAPPPNPYGWFGGPRPVTPTSPAYPVGTPSGQTNDWFQNAVPGPAGPKPWVDSVTPDWFVFDGQYFGIGSATINGIWFAIPPQPTQPTSTSAMSPFTVQAGQSFNFSVWARYLTVQDPSNAHMIMGFRWYYPDGTWTEQFADLTPCSYGYDLGPDYGTPSDQGRYSVPPGLPSYTYTGEPPPELITGALPISVFPYVRFDQAQLASFMLQSAMLSPGTDLPAFIDATSSSQASGDFMVDPISNASYVYRRRVARTERLNTELYRWLPMGSTYTLVYGAGAVQPPLDPTRW
jgi:hypothetical protein